MILITTDAIGGVWSYSLALAAALPNQCTLAVLGPEAQPHQRRAAQAIPGCTLIHTGLPLDWLSPDRATLDHATQALATLAARLGATSAHLHAPCLAAGMWPVPIVVAAHSCMATWWDALRHGPVPAGFAWHAAATREGLARANHVIAPSHAFAAALRDTHALTRPIEIIHNGLPPAPAITAARQAFILTAGRLYDEGKNAAVLDRAAPFVAAPIRAAGPQTGPDGAMLAATRLQLLGNLPPDDLRTLMSRAAIFAAPSFYEPFGLAVLEAAQTGAPLVLADIPTFRELWTGAAIFVPPGDAIAWADALNTLMANPANRAELGRAASSRAATYTQHTMAVATAALHGAAPARQPARAA